MREIPGELIEAARVDGAGHVQIFSRIMLPLMAPAIAAFGIFQFLWVWNDLLVALVFGGGSPDVSPLTVRLAELVGHPRAGLVPALRRRLRLADRPADRVPVAAALLRARAAGRQRQGLSAPGRSGRSGADVLGQPVVGRLGGPGLVLRVDVHDAEGLGVALGPLEVVEQRPDDVARGRRRRPRGPARWRRCGRAGSRSGPGRRRRAVEPATTVSSGYAAPFSVTMIGRPVRLWVSTRSSSSPAASTSQPMSVRGSRTTKDTGVDARVGLDLGVDGRALGSASVGRNGV